MAEHNILGMWGEEKAALYLQKEGCSIVERNWRDGHKDLDIIAIDGHELVIVEVKTRRNNVFIEPETAVDYRKIRNICIAASRYVKLKHITMPLRFDIITVTGTTESDCEINHIKEAFLPPMM